jgi:hypothetical protein
VPRALPRHLEPGIVECDPAPDVVLLLARPISTGVALVPAASGAFVQAYADGKIELPKLPKHAHHIRYAPSFMAGGELRTTDAQLPKPYTADSVAQFLGWLYISWSGRNCFVTRNSSHTQRKPWRNAAVISPQP